MKLHESGINKRKASMHIKGILVGAIVVAVLASASVASAFDRSPVRLSQLRPDGWGNSITGAARDVRRRYSGAGTTYCVGVIMIGHESRSSWVHGTTRYWDKLACAADTGSEYVTFVYDPKGSNAESFTIYRLKHVRK